LVQADATFFMKIAAERRAAELRGGGHLAASMTSNEAGPLNAAMIHSSVVDGLPSRCRGALRSTK
jgi:hypothetical protein